MDNPTAATRARVRALERHGAALIRAMGHCPGADYRSRQLRLDGRIVALASPYLMVDPAAASLPRVRGVADAYSARLRYSNLSLHFGNRPADLIGAVVFDILEQLRCEALLPTALRGARHNLQVMFEDWCRQAREDGWVDSAVGILLYTLIHMVRARLIINTDDEEVAGLIEATRANLSPMIGKPFYQLGLTRHSQEAYAVPALEIASILSELVAADTDPDDAIAAQLNRNTVILGPDWDNQSLNETADGAGGIAGGDPGLIDVTPELAGDYHVFDNQYDQIIEASRLYREAQREQLRHELDRQCAAQTVSVTRLALRLQALFALPQHDGWLFGQEEGLIDGRRLSQLVSRSGYRQVFRSHRQQPVCDAVVGFLIDNSGSMKAQKHESVAVLVDTLVRALDLAGVNSEVLGFTTAAWNGGRPMKAWRGARMPADPGRLNELLHIVYKDAETPWRRARQAISCLMKTHHFRESVDGEALIWAWRRLRQRPESRRILLMISDGAPLDAATYNTNREGFLGDHLRNVVRIIEARGDVTLGAIGIDLDMSETFSRSVNLDLSGTLSLRAYQVLESLFPESRRAG